MSSSAARPLLDSLGCVWPNLNTPQSGLLAMAPQPPFSARAWPTVSKLTSAYFFTKAW